MKVYIVKTTFLDDGYSGVDILLASSFNNAKEEMQKIFNEDWVQELLENNGNENLSIKEDAISTNSEYNTDWCDIEILEEEIDGLRIIKCSIDQKEFLIKTNAPYSIIEAAHKKMFEQKALENNSLSDLDIIKKILEEDKYFFEEINNIETYDW